MQGLIHELLENANNLCRAKYGHHVIKTLLEQCCTTHCRSLAAVLGANDACAVFKYTCHRHASYVVEAALMHCAPEDVRELRNAAFSFGGLEVTRAVVQKFVDSKEVRPLLSKELLQQRRDALDAETAHLMIRAAKSFFSELLKAPRTAGKSRAGRRTDEYRNAFLAGVVALLPRDRADAKPAMLENCPWGPWGNF